MKFLLIAVLALFAFTAPASAGYSQLPWVVQTPFGCVNSVSQYAVASGTGLLNNHTTTSVSLCQTYTAPVQLRIEAPSEDLIVTVTDGTSTWTAHPADGYDKHQYIYVICITGTTGIYTATIYNPTNQQVKPVNAYFQEPTNEPGYIQYPYPYLCS